MAIQTNHSYFFAYDFEDGTDVDNYTKLCVTIPYSQTKPTLAQCNIKIGRYQIYDELHGHVVDDAEFDEDGSSLKEVHLGCFFKKINEEYSEDVELYFYDAYQDYVFRIYWESTDYHYTFNCTFSWISEPINDVSCDDFILEISQATFTPDGYTITLPTNLQVGALTTIRYQADATHKFVLDNSTLSTLNIMDFQESEFSVIGYGNNERKVIFTLSPNGKTLDISFYIHLNGSIEYEDILVKSINAICVNLVASFKIKTYQNSSEPNKINKTKTLISEIDGTLRDACSLINPTIILELNGVPTFNYVYIESFRRYYFVTEITSVRKNLWSITLKVDVLESYKSLIYDLNAYVERNEFQFNNKIEDEDRVIQKGADYEVIDITKKINNEYPFKSVWNHPTIILGYIKG